MYENRKMWYKNIENKFFIKLYNIIYVILISLPYKYYINIKFYLYNAYVIHVNATIVDSTEK